jgi:hypothetical protein
MVDAIRGGLRPATNSVQLTIPPPGLKNHGTSSAARPDAPSCPLPRNSDQTETTVLTKPDRWIQAKPNAVQLSHIAATHRLEIRGIGGCAKSEVHAN